MEMIRVGMVGLGWAGMKHLAALASLEGVEIAGLAGTAKADAMALAGNAPHFGTAKEMIERVQMDAIFLCVTPERHEGLEQLCAQKGIHMYIEKPIEVDYARACAIDEAIALSDVLVSVGYQERYHPGIARAREFLSGRRIRLIHGQWIGHVVGAQWWRTKARSGGQIIEQSTHIFDIIRYLSGDGRVVSAQAFTGVAPGSLANDVEPASIATLLMDNGAIGEVTTGCFLDEKMGGDIGLSLWCDDGRVEFDWVGGEVRLICGDTIENIVAPGGQHAAAVSAFIEAVRTNDGAGILSPYADALKSFAMTVDAQSLIDAQ